MTKRRQHKPPAPPPQTPQQRRRAEFGRIGNDYLAATELAELSELKDQR